MRVPIDANRYDTLVENRSIYGAGRAELNVFATRQYAEGFLLQFDVPVLATMIEGRKVMRLNGGDAFEFLPGESALLGSGTEMNIDFPIATLERPTRCFALAIDPGLISEVCGRLSERFVLPGGARWELPADDLHFRHNPGIQRALDRIVEAFLEDHAGRDLFVEHALEEVMVRLMQFHRLQSVQEGRIGNEAEERLSAVMAYVKCNLDKPIDVAQLSRKAYMSESHFHRVFKQAMGMSPSAYVRRERLRKAAELISEGQLSISAVGEEVGFASVAHFSKAFKSIYGVSPNAYCKAA